MPYLSPKSFVSLIYAEPRLHRWMWEYKFGHVRGDPWGVPSYVRLSGGAIVKVCVLPGDTFLEVSSISLHAFV